jgi:hypothetical protein
MYKILIVEDILAIREEVFDTLLIKKSNVVQA